MRLRDRLAEADGWSLKPAFVSLLVVAVLGFICRLPGSVSFLLIPLTGMGYGMTALVILAVSIYCLLQKRPRRGVSVLLMLLLPVLLWQSLNRVDELAHLALTVNFGAGQLGSSSKSLDGRFTVYDWSVGLAGANTFLIHDVTDEIALPLAQHTHPSSEEDGFGEECAGKVHRLFKHYYVCNT